jgi:hypothetical protein
MKPSTAPSSSAYIRHQHTDYEQRLESVATATFDVDDEINIDSIGHYGEIKRDSHRAVDDFLERHRAEQA